MDLDIPAAVVAEAGCLVARDAEGLEGAQHEGLVGDGDDAAAVQHDLGRAAQEAPGGFRANADGDGEVADAELHDDLEHEERDVVLDGAAERVDADEQEILVVRRAPLIVGSPMIHSQSLDQEVDEDLARADEVEPAGLEVIGKVPAKHLVDAIDAGPVAAQAREGEGGL